jgi:ATP-dependent Clp protease ATP-binding subunit ClpB
MLPRISGPHQTYLSNGLQKILQSAQNEAERLKDKFISVERLILGMLEIKTDRSSHKPSELGLTLDRFYTAMTSDRGNQRVTDENPESKY